MSSEATETKSNERRENSSKNCTLIDVQVDCKINYKKDTLKCKNRNNNNNNNNDNNNDNRIICCKATEILIPSPLPVPSPAPVATIRRTISPVIRLAPVPAKRESIIKSVEKFVEEKQSKTCEKSSPEEEKGKLLSVSASGEVISPSKSILTNGGNQSNTSSRTRSSLKKSVSFDPDNEIVRKFTDGDIIVDKKNPFKTNGTLPSSTKKKTPPPVPVKRSTLSSRQVKPSQQTGEAVISSAPSSVSNTAATSATASKAATPASSPEEFITTEEVLRQSKYVITYIKNPDKYFEYDPSVLARLKLDELRELVDKKALRKVKLSAQTQERLKELKKQKPTSKSKIPSFKKCSKPNYPDLSDIKVKVGTDCDDSLFNPAEVTKNAKKFDERVKKLHISSDDDLEDIEEPLTKSDSSDEQKSLSAVTTTVGTSEKTSQPVQPNGSINKTSSVEAPANGSAGTFTNTVNSKEFQEYLAKKGLSLTPQKLNNNNTVTTNGKSSTPSRITYSAPERVQISIERPTTLSLDIMEATPKKSKKPSVFQRLLPNGIFSSKRKTTPKEPIPVPFENGSAKTSSAIKRVVLERKSFHGSPTTPTSNGILSATLAKDLKKQAERSRKSYAAGDDRSSSISSALTNAEDFVDAGAGHSNESFPPSWRGSGGGSTVGTPQTPQTPQTPSSIEPPSKVASARSRASSKERSNSQNSRIAADARDGIVKTRLQRAQSANVSQKLNPSKSLDRNLQQQSLTQQQASGTQFRRTAERQSLVPKRSTQQTSDKRQLFGRSASMDRHEISKRTSSRQNNSLPKSKSASSTPKGVLTPKNSKENLLESSGPKTTSTPIRDGSEKLQKPSPADTKSISPISAATSSSSNANILDQQEWTKLREIKERTDREFYKKVAQGPNVQSNRNKSQTITQPLISENIYERLPSCQVQVGNSVSPPYQPIYAQLVSESNFVRGVPQRNTISGVGHNRSAKIIDGNAVIALGSRQGLPYRVCNEQQLQKQGITNTIMQPPRSQSVLDDMINPTGRNISNREYRSDSEAPLTVILRRKEPQPPSSTPTSTGSHNQRSGGNLTREEILQKVKEFCRKSMNKTPTKLGSSGQISQHKEMNGRIPADLSPVSYASVETQNRSSSRMAAAPQVPQRMQSLPPMSTQPPPSTPTTSPIYAHVIKRNSIQSNLSDPYDSPQRRGSSLDYYQHRSRLPTQINETDSVFLPKSVNLPPDRACSPARFVVMDSDKVTPAHVVKFRNDSFASPTSQYVSVSDHHQQQIQQMPNSYGYIHLKPSSQQRARLNDGRSTPLILERGNQVGSQIYWSPTPRLHHSPRLPVQLSPRYVQQQLNRPAISINGHVSSTTPAPATTQTANFVYLNVQDQAYRPIGFPTQQLHSNSLQTYATQSSQQQQQMPHIQQPQRPLQSGAYPYESESGSEAGEVQRIMERQKMEEDWQNQDKTGRSQSNDQATDERRRAARREDPRRHTLGGDMLQYGGGQGQPQQRAMDLENQPIRGYVPINQGPLFDEDPGIMSEVETASTGFRRGGKQRSSLPVVRTPSKTLERPLGLVFLQYRSETKRALLPNEITSIDTVRALFVRSFPRQLTMTYLEGPNVKIYIHDASKDMFYELEDVRSHLREIRDRSVLRLFESNEVAAPPQALPGGPGIPQPLPQTAPQHWDQDQSYFSEPEFDSEYQHQHIHKSKAGKQAPYYVGTSQTLPRGMYSDRNKAAVGAPAKPLRSYGSRGSMGPPFPYPPDQLYSIPDGYTSSPERGTRGSYEEPYYSQYGTRGSTVAPIIDEEHNEVAMPEDQYALYGMKVGPGRIPRSANQMYDPTRPEDLHRIRVEHMERQLANLTGLVQKALVNQNPQIAPVATMNPNFLGVPPQCRGALIDDMDGHSSGSSTSIQDKSVSFEKSVSFSDDIQGAPKSHSPQHAADSKPAKPAIKSSTLPRTSSQERDRLKPPPPPKPLALAQTHPTYRADIALAPEVYNHLRGLQKKAKDLRMEVRTLRRLSQAQAVAVREDIKDAFMRIRATLMATSGNYWGQQGDQEKTRISREEELYKQEVIRLEKDLSDLESSVEGLRGEVINRRTRVNMAAVEDMALVLSRASKTVAELKMRFPGLQNGLRNILSNEMEKVVREEKFLKEEPDRLESALRRCKKLTGTLVTLKRLASVQEQRLPTNESTSEDPPRSAEISTTNKPVPSPRMGPITISGGIPPENALDALLDELQTFAKPVNQINDLRPDDSTSDDSSQAIHNTVTTQLSQASLYISNDPSAPLLQLQQLQQQQYHQQLAGPTFNSSTLPNINRMNNINNNNPNTLHVNTNIGSLRRLHSYPSGSDTDTSPPQPQRALGKPPVPERNAELLSKVGTKRVPPPPPPRTSSRSPLASPTSPNIPSLHRLPSLSETEAVPCGNGGGVAGNENGSGQDGSGNSSSNESGNDHAQRQVALEMRHQELLKKQKMLQEQYARLQQMSKNPVALQPPPTDIMILKKTGSESNLPQKMGLSMAAVTGSMKNLNTETHPAANSTTLVSEKNEKNLANSNNSQQQKNQQQPKPNVTAGAIAAIATTNGGGESGSGGVGGGGVGNTGTTKVYETDIL